MCSSVFEAQTFVSLKGQYRYDQQGMESEC